MFEPFSSPIIGSVLSTPIDIGAHGFGEARASRYLPAGGSSGTPAPHSLGAFSIKGGLGYINSLHRSCLKSVLMPFMIENANLHGAQAFYACECLVEDSECTGGAEKLDMGWWYISWRIAVS